MPTDKSIKPKNFSSNVFAVFHSHFGLIYNVSLNICLCISISRCIEFSLCYQPFTPSILRSVIKQRLMSILHAVFAHEMCEPNSRSRNVYVQMCEMWNSWSSSIYRSQRSIDETKTHSTYSHTAYKILNAKHLTMLKRLNVLLPFRFWFLPFQHSIWIGIGYMRWIAFRFRIRARCDQLTLQTYCC